ncbi:flagellar hook-length control protein FliK [Nitrosomonas sp. Nm166]|uniref:flagellar hook-length control protein FliK n=1 Tax=Nitrosomonas sp. Nm166 TaxID=1881054 RepID=UPI0008E5890D|nr:flagellar hook-length control protein FliK [Nitrosomonas sp. Nm166]SFE99090.1 flagellar hook-length control protein FliK [Nitrosomonas sp. Nm166]
MLNISAIPQIKSSVDNPIAISNSGGGNPQQPATEEFAKVMKREVSETTSKHEANHATDKTAIAESAEHAASSEKGDAAPTTITHASDTHHLINNGFIDAAPYPVNSLSFPLESVPNPDTLMTTSILPATLSALPSNSLMHHDNELATSQALLTNQMLQQRFVQTIAANDFTYLTNDFWQAFDTANSAAYGKLLPFSSEMSEAIPINIRESIFSGFNESIPTSLGLSHTASAAPLNTTLQNVQVDLAVGQPKWNGEFAQKIVWLTTQQHQVAEVHLNPAHLGPVEVMLSIMQDQATAQFLSPHAAVREAIEEALPRLREMMAENGIQLGNVMVGSDSFQQENRQQQAYPSAKNTPSTMSTRTETTSQIETTVLTNSNRHHGIVDTYA